MLTVTVLRTEDFNEENIQRLQGILIDLIKNRGAKIILAGGDSKDATYRLFCNLAVQYPDIFFSILLSDDKLAYEGSDPQIFSLDGDVIYKDPMNAAENRDRKLIGKADILICRKVSTYDDFKKIISQAGRQDIEIITI